MSDEIKKQLLISAATTAGSIAGVIVAQNTGWNKTITIASGSLAGLLLGVGLGLIETRESETAGQ